LLTGLNGKVVLVNREGEVERSFRVVEGQVPLAVAMFRGYVVVGTKTGGVYLYSMQPWRVADSLILESKEPVERMSETNGFLTIIDAFEKRSEFGLLEQRDKVKLFLRDQVGQTDASEVDITGTSVVGQGGRWGLGGIEYVAPTAVASVSAEFLERGRQLAALFSISESQEPPTSFFVTEQTQNEMLQPDVPEPADVYVPRRATPVNYVSRHMGEVYLPLYLNSKLPPSMQAREALVVDFSKRRSDFLRRNPDDFGIELDAEGKKLWRAASDLQAFAQAAAERVKVRAAVKP
jgi:hypothetical protein